MTLKTTELKNRLRNAQKIAILAIGSELRGDDAAGMLVAKHLDKACCNIKKEAKFKVFFGDTAPENLTGEIKRFKPTHLVIIDSADFNDKPGAVKLIDADKIDGFSSCTHSLPIKILRAYLINCIGCEIIIIGIQPCSISFGSGISKEVKDSAERVSSQIKEAIGNS
ncbi:MAG: hydrogenase maturation peptidase HycI [Candidatus Omnitrophica bacterium]|nr:hydrogenase maturation peptidase HycI [Candidatus Omnitrophota bacterium]